MTGDSCGSSPRGSEVAEEVAVERTVSLKRRCSRSAMSRKGVSSRSSAIGDGQQEVQLRSSAMGDVWQEAWLEAWQERDRDIDRESQQGNLRWRRVCPRSTWRRSVSFLSFSLPMALSALRSMSSAMSRARMISSSAEQRWQRVSSRSTRTASSSRHKDVVVSYCELFFCRRLLCCHCSDWSCWCTLRFSAMRLLRMTSRHWFSALTRVGSSSIADFV